MSDELTDLIGRLPGALPPVRWAPAAELRRIGRNRRRRRSALAALGVVLAVAAGTGVAYRLVSPTAAPFQPSTSDTATVTAAPSPTRTPSTTPGPVVETGPVPPSVMLAEADVPGYRVIDQISMVGTGPASDSPYVTFIPACAAYADITLVQLVRSLDFRAHTYFVGGDLSQPHFDETVVRAGSAEAVQAARERMLRAVRACQDPLADDGTELKFVIVGTDPAGQSAPQFWTVVTAPSRGLLAIVRSPTPMDDIGDAMLARLTA
jgi:hypothetical protein